ncbi:MAG TPA: hypothetical protein VK526_08835, partial [Bradyrhizobium sp.]|nr:hypothetical protein [Bradyrhizobium sp.]
MIRPFFMGGLPKFVIASEAKQSSFKPGARWIASRSLSSGAHSRDPLARNDESRKGPDHRSGPFSITTRKASRRLHQAFLDERFLDLR